MISRRPQMPIEGNGGDACIIDLTSNILSGGPAQQWSKVAGMKGQGFMRRFGYARNGIVTALRRERSMRTHAAAAVAVAIFLALTKAAALWWALVGLAVGLVLVAEMANTAIEALADLLHPGQHPEIGVAKDVAAGAVLIATLVAIVVGLAYCVELLR
jgi:diacylglycerol kinase (ATP)